MTLKEFWILRNISIIHERNSPATKARTRFSLARSKLRPSHIPAATYRQQRYVPIPVETGMSNMLFLRP